jgi:hypothetical protein
MYEHLAGSAGLPMPECVEPIFPSAAVSVSLAVARHQVSFCARGFVRS